MIALPAAPTGEQLINALRDHAQANGLSLVSVVSDLSIAPTRWIDQVRAASKPRRTTVDRVRALLAGNVIPPPADSHQLRRAKAEAERDATLAADRRAQARRLTTRHPLDLQRSSPAPIVAIDGDRRPSAWSREPCPRCAVRGDIGCAHQLPFEVTTR